MFKVERSGPNRVDIEFSGKLDREAMKQALDDLLEKSEGIESGRMLYRIGEFDLPTLGAIGEELKRLPKMLALIGKFDRAAVLADQDWIQVASEVEGKFIPGIKIKAFDLDDVEEAEEWLAH